MSNGIPFSSNKSSLKGKVAVVTGSTQGLGEATLRLFKERGCRGLVITGRNEKRGERLAKELTSSSCTAIFVKADLANLDECRNIMNVTDETFGTLDILVNAGATTDRGSIWDTTPEDYDRIMNVNTRAPFFLTQDAVRIMEREHVEGSIINISSTASYGSMPMLAAYGMSKGALNVATKNAAYSLMWSRIRVNALAIGWMDTPGEDEIQRRLHCGNGSGNGDDWKRNGEQNQPFGRLLKPDEVARCIAFCASEESGMMTGCVIDFDQSVFGAGNAPVPPRKEEWARANGMTFSFEQKESKATPKAKKTVATSTQSTRTSAPPPPAGNSNSNSSNSKNGGSGSSSSPVRARWSSDAKKKTSASTSTIESTKIKAPTKKTNAQKQTKSEPEEQRKLSDPGTTSKQQAVAKGMLQSTTNDSDSYSDDDESDKEKVKETQGAPRPSAATKNPMDEPYPDEDRPDPKEFMVMGKMQREGVSDRLDEYLPGTDPFAGAQKKKDKAKKKYGGGNSENYGKSKVDEWLGSGKTQQRTWRVKKEKPPPSS